MAFADKFPGKSAENWKEGNPDWVPAVEILSTMLSKGKGIEISQDGVTPVNDFSGVFSRADDTSQPAKVGGDGDADGTSGVVVVRLSSNNTGVSRRQVEAVAEYLMSASAGKFKFDSAEEQRGTAVGSGSAPITITLYKTVENPMDFMTEFRAQFTDTEQGRNSSQGRGSSR
ncbi:MAG: hypothetical protein SFX19_04290 [Alphaproteobacteria bacterium]|nr:hypothetical protein [Alphaproteobacteria bacterium]